MPFAQCAYVQSSTLSARCFKMSELSNIHTYLQGCRNVLRSEGGRGAGGEYCVLKWIFAPSAKIKIMFEVISIKFWYTANVYRGFRGVHRFSLQCLWKRIARITEKPYTHETERLCVLWGNPEIFTDCGELR